MAQVSTRGRSSKRALLSRQTEDTAERRGASMDGATCRDTATAGRGILHCPAFRAEYGAAIGGVGNGYYLRSLSSVDAEEDVYAPFVVLARTCCDDSEESVTIEIAAISYVWIQGIDLNEGQSLTISVPDGQTVKWGNSDELYFASTPEGQAGTSTPDYIWAATGLHFYGLAFVLLPVGITPAVAPNFLDTPSNPDGSPQESYTFDMDGYTRTLSADDIAALTAGEAFPLTVWAIFNDNFYSDNSGSFTVTMTRF